MTKALYTVLACRRNRSYIQQKWQKKREEQRQISWPIWSSKAQTETRESSLFFPFFSFFFCTFNLKICFLFCHVLLKMCPVLSYPTENVPIVLSYPTVNVPTVLSYPNQNVPTVCHVLLKMCPQFLSYPSENVPTVFVMSYWKCAQCFVIS